MSDLASIGVNTKLSVGTSSLIGAGIMLATEIFKLINTNNSRKYCAKLIDKREDLSKELRRPLNEQNDALIEKLQEDIANIQDLAIAELKAYAASNTK